MKHKTALTIMSAGLAVSAAIGVTMITSTAQAQSFSCSRAEVPSEMAICNNENLLMKDERVAGLYADAFIKATQTDSAELLTNQHSTWLKRRNDCKADFNCLERRYDERIWGLARDL